MFVDKLMLKVIVNDSVLWYYCWKMQYFLIFGQIRFVLMNYVKKLMVVIIIVEKMD